MMPQFAEAAKMITDHPPHSRVFSSPGMTTKAVMGFRFVKGDFVL